MAQHYPEMLMMAFKDAVVKVYYTRKDLRSVLDRCEVATSLIVAQDWNRYKYHIVSPILDHLNGSQVGLRPLRLILTDILSFKNCDHLLWMNDGKLKKKEAEESLSRFRALVKEHDVEVKQKEVQRQERVRRREESARGAEFQGQLDTLRDDFLRFLQDADRQKSGYGLEVILHGLFELFELNPKAPFRRTGEQIDGAFEVERDHYLLEAKWKTLKTQLSDLRDLDGAVGSSLDNTLGLFISINGFSKVALDGYVQGSRPKISCMDGGDLMAVLEGRIDLSVLVSRKKDIASQKRCVFA